MVPVAHVTALHTLRRGLRSEVFEVVAQVTEASPRALGAAGTTVFSNQDAPDQPLRHLHVHVVPRHPGDDLTIPNPVREPVPRELRAELAARLRRAPGGPVPYRPGRASRTGHQGPQNLDATDRLP